MTIENNYIFNFSASYSGGGYKRLGEYIKAFNFKGGATFIINPRCRDLAGKFPNNKYFFVEQPLYERILSDCAYMPAILRDHGKPDLYYSYGIPIYSRVGKVNWFHLSNALPLAPSGIPMTLFDNLKMRYLGWRIRNCLINADVVSAESKFSLALFDSKEKERLFLSVNGSNDELDLSNSNHDFKKDNIAVVIGTYRYKAIEDSFRVFEMIRQCHSPYLKLVIIGFRDYIPKNIRINSNVITTGLLARHDVIAYLRKAKYYISTTHIENSYNAASEGVFFAEESYISDIGPHRELLINMPFDIIPIPNVAKPVLHIKQCEITADNLKSWHAVITEMVEKTQSMLPPT